MHLLCFKSRYVFLFGFGIGFFGALLLFIIQNAFNTTSVYRSSLSNCKSKRQSDFVKWIISGASHNEEIVIQTWKRKAENSQFADVAYSKWLTEQNLKISYIDMDAYLYGSERPKKFESDWLKSSISITCIVFVKKIKLARSIQNTWGKRCNKLYFFGQHNDSEVSVVNLEIKLTSSWQLLCEAFNYVWKDHGTSQWIIFVKDDTLVIPENLRFMVAPLNFTQDYYLGHAVTLWGQPYNVADAGYVISKSVVKKLVDMFDSPEKCAAGGKYWKQEDYYLGKFDVTSTK